MELFKKMFILILSNIVNEPNHSKWVSLNNHKSIIQTTLINLHPNECSQEFHCHSSAVELDKCVGSCNNLNEFFIYV